jgi:hypothetical protein
MRRVHFLAAVLAAFFGVACDEDTTGWDRPYSTTAGLLCVEPVSGTAPGNLAGVDTWKISCAYLAQGQCGSDATFVQYVSEWGQCWDLVDACMAGKDCVVPAGKLAGRPLVDPSTGRTRFNGILSGGFDAGMADGGGNGP